MSPQLEKLCSSSVLQTKNAGQTNILEFFTPEVAGHPAQSQAARNEEQTYQNMLRW